MKKTIAAIAIAATAAIIGIQTARADVHHDPTTCLKPGTHSMTTEVTDRKEAREHFLHETVALRKKIAVKSSELRALYHAKHIDKKAVVALQGALFDLQEQLSAKARKAGITGYGQTRHHGPMAMGDHGRRFCQNEWTR